MATWYSPANPDDDRLLLYSERGVMAYLFISLLREQPELILDNAQNGDGTTLRDSIEGVKNIRLLTEFELGNKGFGCPDSGLLLQDNEDRWHFVFVEAKTEPWAVSHQGPTQRTPEELSSLSYSELDRLCVRDKFNSSINGQLELRWRFVNAFRNTPENLDLVIERNVPELLMKSDRFYWRRRLLVDETKNSDWRRVQMGTGLRPLRELLLSVEDRFHLLTITTDTSRPEMNDVRLFNEGGHMMSQRDAGVRLFWMGLRVLTDQLREI